ncbi:patatin-like phospholipase family protein (plasmid) [Bradyrhizobium barranii subsp. barranii]|uniref:Patatin-like phospholipase family protein n=2 Tax=Bradyrhizobium barranii subsp. barranii TaxID=2823807 RepID=A0A9X9YFY5_9BRAD|nr:patatin-like phospholipase family protein [Bradyrhizobium barranii]UGX89840.1 patatin-like phospholipase family protein [Bradyrhizobium barranii subsp. barranii]
MNRTDGDYFDGTKENSFLKIERERLDAAPTVGGLPVSRTDRDYFDGTQENSFLKMERERLDAARPGNRRGKAWNGVALSGGGIRSATFCLGAMQALAEHERLEHFDYMSSVSGGGYTASALQWWWWQPKVDEIHPNRFDATKQNFPYGTELGLGPGRTSVNDRVLDFLRQHGKYLTPGDGLTMWSVVSVLLRALLLNLAVWIPLAAVGFFMLIGAGYLAVQFGPEYVKHIPNLLSGIIGDDWTGVAPKCGQHHCRLPFTTSFGLLIWVFAGISGFFAVFAVLLSFLSFASRPDWINSGQSLRSRTVVVILFFAVACGCLIYHLLSAGGRWQDWAPTTLALAATALSGVLISVFLILSARQDSNYYWRRRFETSSGTWLVYAIVVLVIGSVPLLPYYLLNYGGTVSKTLSALLGALGGIGSALYGHSVQSRRESSGGLGSVMATIGSAIFIYSTLICAYLLAQLLVNTHDVLRVSAAADRWIEGMALFSIVLAFFIATLSNINYFGLHRFYRDRIMEAFMPSLQTVRGNHTVPSKEADNLQITDLWPDKSGVARNIPYPLINTNVVLVNDEEPKYSVRGGDNFVVSPLFVGSKATGWQDTPRYIFKNGALTLASAMASSGAALNANAAYAGSGITRDRLLSIVMMLLNLRLGLWSATPSAKAAKYRLFTPNHFHPGLTFGLFRYGYKRNSDFVELTDGGHFDNIGLYELVRRRCSTIVVVDAEADPTTSMPALVSIVQRIEQDFGAKIDLGPAVVDAIVPVLGAGFPPEAKYVKAPFFATDITYAAAPSLDAVAAHPTDVEKALSVTKGRLVYVKAGLIADLDFATKGYWAQNPTFPHQSTADQFFDPKQFEAYRQLGYRSMQKAIAGEKTLQQIDKAVL